MEAFLVRKLPVVNAERQMLNAEAARDFQNARTLGCRGCKARTLWLLRWQSEDAYLTEMAKRGRFAYCKKCAR
jgi:hypothetical protein